MLVSAPRGRFRVNGVWNAAPPRPFLPAGGFSCEFLAVFSAGSGLACRVLRRERPGLLQLRPGGSCAGRGTRNTTSLFRNSLGVH